MAAKTDKHLRFSTDRNEASVSAIRRRCGRHHRRPASSDARERASRSCMLPRLIRSGLSPADVLPAKQRDGGGNGTGTFQEARGDFPFTKYDARDALSSVGWGAECAFAMLGAAGTGRRSPGWSGRGGELKEIYSDPNSSLGWSGEGGNGRKLTMTPILRILSVAADYASIKEVLKAQCTPRTRWPERAPATCRPMMLSFDLPELQQSRFLRIGKH